MPDRTEEQKLKSCFIIGPSGERGSKDEKRARWIEQLVEHALKYPEPYPLDYKYEVTHVDSISTPGMKLWTIAERLASVDIVIADLYGGNPEIYYHMAIRHVVNKPIISLADPTDNIPIPSTLAGMDSVPVSENDPYTAESEIRKRVKKTEDPKYVYSPPFSDVLIQKFFEKYAGDREQHLADYFRKQFDHRISELSRVTQLIEESTRKPLNGIDEVFKQIWEMLKTARVGGRLWFVGMTFGFGPPHCYRTRKLSQMRGPEHRRRISVEDTADPLLTIDQQFNWKWPEIKSFKAVIDECKDKLGRLVEAAHDPVLVCLKQDSKFLSDNFLKKLCMRSSYESLKEDVKKVTKQIIERHKYVAEKLRPEARPISYVDSIPLQIVIVEKETTAVNALGRKACVVFHVGTGNIETHVLEDGETGFYTEVDSVVEMFETMAESLWESAQGRAPQPPSRPRASKESAGP